MILRLLKNHPITARKLRLAITRKSMLVSGGSGVWSSGFASRRRRWLVAPFFGLVVSAFAGLSHGQQPANERPLHEAYQQQLQENQRRLAVSGYQYAVQTRHNAAAQTYFPPVHIAPSAPGGHPRTLNGRYNSVQEYDVSKRPAFASLGDQQPAARPTLAPVPAKESNLDGPKTATAPEKSEEHVFLQDRIASAISKRLKRPSVKALARTSDIVLPPISTRTNFERVELEQPQQELVASAPEVEDQVESLFADEFDARDTEVAQAASDTDWDYIPQWDDTDETELAIEIQEPRLEVVHAHSVLDEADASASREQVVAYEEVVDSADDLDEEIARIDREYAQSLVQHSSFDNQGPPNPAGFASPQRLARRAKPFVSPRPIAYRPTQNRLRASELSMLVSQGNVRVAQEDAKPTLSNAGDRLEDRFAEEEFSKPAMPTRRDDLESLEDFDADEELATKSRVRSRIEDDELDLDDDEEDLDDDEEDDEDVGRPRIRPCNEFREELLATSIRDISLDISPSAYSTESVLGGPYREWTDRSGNVIASGTMIDLRRGYVILDSGVKLAYARLGAEDLAAVSEFWRLPTVCLLGNRGGSPHRCWTPQGVTWKASSLCHKPLYFENVQLERYGHSRGPFAQPIHSTLHFFTSLVSLPYNAAIWPATECQYALGYYRPGNCAPWLKDPVPISLEGVRRQAMVATGAALIP